MPPKGDRPSAASSTPAKKAAAPVKKAATPVKSATPAKDEKRGLFGGIKDFFSGGAKSGPTAADRPRARPDVVKTGTGKDTQYKDIRTGQSFAAPSYGAASFRGLTSTDPANVARNRYGAERAMAAERQLQALRPGRDRDRGIASLVAPTTPPGTTPGTTPAAQPAAPTPAELAALGAPTTPMAPIFVEPPTYTRYDLMEELGPVGGYGTAFVEGPQPQPINWMDIFNTYPNFGMR